MINNIKFFKRDLRMSGLNILREILVFIVIAVIGVFYLNYSW